MAILKHFNVYNRRCNDAVIYLLDEHDSHPRPVHERKARKEIYQGLTEGYRPIEEQVRQQQRQRTAQYRREGFHL